MTKTYIDHAETIAKQDRAVAEAKRRLNARGIYYPICDGSLSPDENYQRIMQYSRIEAEEIVKILREPAGGVRPLELDNVKPKKMGWDGYSD